LVKAPEGTSAIFSAGDEKFRTGRLVEYRLPRATNIRV